ncbi:uncharacterized protein B0P05DRAFT_592377 [Gilbertella persicaria]|uniref:uncharacterized protein n=1 Tax=Gilbertella persicaria TaxID=101096 RepID=UPI00221E6866|nr:uncharacterized protein B0P05DRAFT_592377 [Gilbertella persicaria]KAI8048030.1 hypothetical protein B0P05DRAFT_592377 [Gilbertella persicaria]
MEEVFPESAHLLCCIHIERHFRERSLKEINPKFAGKKKPQMLSTLCLSDERDQYEAEHRRLILDIARGCTTKESYEDAKNMIQSEVQWGSYYTNAHPHMNNRSINRVEGTHAVTKQSIGSSKGKMGPVTDKIAHWYKMRNDYRNLQMEHESLPVPVSVLTSEVEHLLKPLQGKITNFALIKVNNQLVKGLKEKQGQLSSTCSCFVKVWWLPW